jgi:hypothetical protein
MRENGEREGGARRKGVKRARSEGVRRLRRKGVRLMKSQKDNNSLHSPQLHYGHVHLVSISRLQILLPKGPRPHQFNSNLSSCSCCTEERDTCTWTS